MSLNFPLILLVLTVFTGLVALLDKLWLSKKRKQDEAESFVVEQSKSFFPILAIIFVLRSFIAEPFQIPSGSMEPGLVQGDFILVSKFSYGLRMPVWGNTLVPTGEPERGDVMVFFPPDDPRYFIKRVIGLPGDRIVYRNRQLFINGEEVPTTDVRAEPSYRPTKYLANEQLGETEATVQWLVGRSNLTGEPIVWAGPEGEWTVPENHFFTMGDNRGNSGDSRSWGMVPNENVVGKAVAIWMHWDKWTDLPSFSRNGWIK